MPERPEIIKELLSLPRERLSEVTYTLSEAQLEKRPGVDILSRIQEIPPELIARLSTYLRDNFDPMADGWSDHYSLKDPNGWRDSWKDKQGFEIPLDRVSDRFLRGPSFG